MATTPALSGNRCQCTACGEVFKRARLFDRHRVGRYAVLGKWPNSRRCLTPKEMQERGWIRNEAGIWTMKAPDVATFRAEGAPEGRPLLTLGPTGGRA